MSDPYSLSHINYQLTIFFFQCQIVVFDALKGYSFEETTNGFRIRFERKAFNNEDCFAPK